MLDYDMRHGYRTWLTRCGGRNAPDQRKCPSLKARLATGRLCSGGRTLANPVKRSRCYNGTSVTLEYVEGVRWRCRLPIPASRATPRKVTDVLQSGQQNCQSATAGGWPVLSVNFGAEPLTRRTAPACRPGRRVRPQSANSTGDSRSLRQVAQTLPLLYTAAMDKGPTLASISNDADFPLGTPVPVLTGVENPARSTPV